MGLIIAKTSAFNMFLKFCKLSELIIEDELKGKLATLPNQQN